MAQPKDKLAELVASYWRGEQPLWASFWLYGGFFFSIIEAARTLVAPMENVDITASFVMVLMIFFVWNLVAAWRSAFNCKNKKWGYIARILYVISVAYYGWEFWNYLSEL